MARSGSYDDLSDNRVSRRGNRSSKILLATILLSILICIIALFCWVKLMEAEEVKKANQASTVEQKPSETPVAEAKADVQDEILAPTVNEKLSSATANVDLTIDSALSSLSSSESSGMDYISSGDYSLSSDPDAPVVEESIEMKKPVIAQNLSRSQQPTLSKDLVKWQEYTIKAGDSLTDIAKSFGLDVQTIISVNHIKSVASLWIGSTMQIPDRDGTLYTVREGDTLSSIIEQFSLGISAGTLADVNGILDGTLQAGQELFIPYDTIETSGTITADEMAFSIPEGKAVGMYNQKVPNPIGNDSLQLDGILLQGNAGDPVCAAEAGTVVDKGFNENGSGFVKIMHSNGYTSYYDYLGDISVETADSVQKGQQIGVFMQGSTSYDNPVVFFRIEQGGVAFDPYSF
ncbi:MAG: LysM peptidoglycan-binding domain-containing M23 family metallopeptidase [Spirochaetales bacterium]|nr:LysM peptidoglycan-binding domain-containing M23 family metallopeptidase [Spirochaetales bacterium]